MKKHHVTLSEPDRTSLEDLISTGELAVRVYRRTLALLELDRGQTFSAVAQTLQVHPNTVAKWAQRYQDEQLQCLQDKPRSGRPVEIKGILRAKITTLACSDAPDGYSQWSLRLLADKAVALGYCDQISPTKVGQILKKTRLSLI